MFWQIGSRRRSSLKNTDGARGGGRRSAAGASVERLETRAMLSAAVEHVIHVSVDGLRPDAITQLGPSQLPNFYRLRTEGAFTDNARTDHDVSVTLPNHTTQVTARPVMGSIGHNWAVNSDPAAGQTLHSNKGSYVASFWDVAHDQGLRTALYAGKTKFSVYDTSYDGDAANLQGGAPDVNPAGGDNGRDKIDVYQYHASSATLTDAFVTDMRTDPFELAMLHYHDPDTVGHSKGWMTTDYLNSIRLVDQQLGKVLMMLEDQGGAWYGRTALILTADHGGSGTNHADPNDPQAYTLPFFVWGPGVAAGAELYQLNGATRSDPGGGRLDNLARPQPIRNGDAGNLALQLLDLPSIPGSLFNARQDLIVGATDPQQAPSAVLTAPADNGPGDLDPAAGAVRVTATQSGFRLRLSDADGVDDATVTPQAFRMTADGFAFGDYSFAYDPATDTVTLTPTAGSFSFGQFEIHFNDTRTRVADSGGNALSTTVLRLSLERSGVQPTTATFQQNAGQYAGTRDTQLAENAPTTGYATAPSLNVDTDDPSGTNKKVQALLRFEDLFGSGAGQIPTNAASIDSAFLELRVTDGGTGLNLHRMLQSWAETATWSSLTSGVQTDNVEALTAFDASTGAVAIGTLRLDVTASLRAWLANPAANYGWALLSKGTDGIDFDSAQGATAPKLIVQYTATTSPTAAADAYATDEDVALTVAAPGVLANDTDPEGQPLAAVLASGPSFGTVELNPDGSFVYTPNANLYGTDYFAYQATDGTSGSSPTTVAITVNPANDGPAAAGDAYSVNENATLAGNVLENDGHPDADELSASLVTDVANGALLLNADGTFTYAPNAGYVGPDGFTYVAGDEDGESSEVVTVSITVVAVNDPPVAAGDAYEVAEDGALSGAASVLANDSDAEQDPLTAALVSDVTNGTLALNGDGTFTYAPAPDYFGQDAFTYRASDGNGVSAIATVTINVTPVNDAPSANDDGAGTETDTPVIVAVLANDVDADGDALVVSIVDPDVAGDGLLDSGTAGVQADGSVRYVPNAGFVGTDSFRYSISDGAASSEALVTVTVREPNWPPTAVADGYVLDEDAVLSALDVLANDSDPNAGTSLTAVVVNGVAHGTLERNADGTFTYTPDANFSGADGFTYVADDGSAQSAPVTVGIDVTAVNDVPVVAAAIADGDVTEGTSRTVIDLGGTFADVDGGQLTLSVEANDNPALVSAALAGETLTLTYAAGVTGSATITVRATDASGAFVEDVFVATVSPVLPVYAGGENTVHGTVVAGNLNATVSDDDGYQSIREAGYAGGKRNRLEHRWTFELGGAAAGGNFQLQAHTSAGANESFQFQYSTDGASWTGMVTVTGTADLDQYQTYQLPAALTGRIYVRVVDANPAGDDRSPDTIHVDHMFIRTTGGGIVRPTVTIVASDGDADESGDAGTFTVTRTGDTAAQLVVNYGVSGAATAGSDYAALGGSVTIAAGSSVAVFSINPIDDVLVEAAEDVVVTLSGSADYVVGSGGSATVVIADDDAVDTQAPTAPAALTVSATTSATVSLQWGASEDNVGVTGYEIWRDGVRLTTTTATTFTDSGLAASTAYAYEVRAYDAAGNVSAGSNSVSATTQGAPAGPVAPSGFTAELVQKNKARLKWQDNSTDEDGFYVEHSTDGVSWTRYATVAAKSGTGTTVQFTTGALPAGRHYFRAVAFNASGNSASEERSILV